MTKGHVYRIPVFTDNFTEGERYGSPTSDNDLPRHTLSAMARHRVLTDAPQLCLPCREGVARATIVSAVVPFNSVCSIL